MPDSRGGHEPGEDELRGFEDGDQLGRVVSRIEARLDSTFSFADEKAHSAAATLALLRMMVAHANAILAVSVTPYAETAGANARAMFEAWLDIYAILEAGHEEDNARRFVGFCVLVFRDYSIATGRLDDDDISKINMMIEAHRIERPQILADVKLQRTTKHRRNSHYWTGTSRTALIKLMEDRGVGSALRSIYKMLSWDAHHVIVVALRSSIATHPNGATEVGFHALQTPTQAALVNRYLAVKMLVKAWWQVTQHLGIDPG